MDARLYCVSNRKNPFFNGFILLIMGISISIVPSASGKSSCQFVPPPLPLKILPPTLITSTHSFTSWRRHSDTDTHARRRTQIRTRAHTGWRAHRRTRTHIHTRAYTHTRTHAYTHRRMHARAHRHTHTHARTHTNTHTHQASI